MLLVMKLDPFVTPIKNQIAVVLGLVVLPIIQQEELLNKMAKKLEWCHRTSYRGKFQWKFYQGKGNLVLVSGEFELSELE